MLVEALVNQGWQKVEKEGHTFVHDPHTTIVWKFVAPYSLMDGAIIPARNCIGTRWDVSFCCLSS
jgi:hypothetical protein